MANYVFADAETANGGLEYSMEPHQFVRLFQWAHNDGPVQKMEVHTEGDLETVRNILRAADYIVLHNGISADLPWIFGVESLEPLQMAMRRKVVDTFVIASLVTPAPNRFTAVNGHTFVDADKPGTAMKWLGLENLCHQFGIPGKLGDLKELAKRHNPPGTKVADLDFSLIPLDDPDFLAYADQDVIALRGLFYFLMSKIKELNYNRDYIWDELESAAAMEVMSRNGILVDQDWAHGRIAEMDAIRQEKMAWLVEEYGFPTEGKAPWASAKGKEVILKVLADFGVTEKSVPDWPRTPTGALKLGGEDLLLVTEGFDEDAQEFAQTIAILKGQRTLPQLVLDSMKEDGRVHPQITSLQRSGRWSVTKPGVTIFGSNGGRDVDKSIFIAEPGKVLAGFDYSNADPRAMAALSGDDEFAIRFTENDPETGKPYDGHNLSGEALFGKEVYYSRFKDDGKPLLRPVAKAAANALNYNVGPLKLAATLNTVVRKEQIDIEPFTKESARAMIDQFNASYPWLKAFKDRAAAEGESKGYIEDSWGRRMQIVKDRAWTMCPALYGQGAVRNIMRDAILKIVREGGPYYAKALRAVIHDELLMELEEGRLEQDIEFIKRCMETVFHPPSNVSIPIHFPVGYGYGRSWREANH